MRRLLVFLVVLGGLVPAAAAAGPSAPTDGTLVVRGGDGVVAIDLLRGAVLGRVANGSVVVIDPRSGECDSILVWEQGFRAEAVERELRTGELKCVFSGRNMRFRIVGGEPYVQLRGTNISVTAVGRGQAVLKGRESGTPSDGRYSLNGGIFEPFPIESVKLTIGAPLAP